MLIMNERTFVEDCISGKVLPSEIKMGRAKMASMLSSYFDNDLKNIQYIIALMENFYQDEFIKENWEPLIEKIITSQKKNNKLLIEREYIPIYQSDIDFIQTAPTELQQKLIFTAFVLARYRDKGGWIGIYKLKDIREWFNLANIKTTPTGRYLMIGELEKLGFLTGAKKNDNINEHIAIEHSGPEIMQIRTLKNIGNQYLEKYKDGWKMCEVCGKMIKVGGLVGRPKKYCNKCSIVMHQIQDKEYQKKKRQSIKT